MSATVSEPQPTAPAPIPEPEIPPTYLEVQVTIRLGNDAMRNGADVWQALQHVAEHFDSEHREDIVEAEHTRSIRDDNGNRVGGFKIARVES